MPDPIIEPITIAVAENSPIPCTNWGAAELTRLSTCSEAGASDIFVFTKFTLRQFYRKISRKSPTTFSTVSPSTSRALITATESAPASITLFAFARVIPPIATIGFVVSARARRTPSRPNHRLRIQLRSCSEHRPNGNVIGTRLIRDPHLLVVMSRNPNPPLGTHHPPRILRRQIPLPHMHSTKPRRSHQIRAVIHDQPAVTPSENLPDHRRITQDRLRRTHLIAILQQCRPGSSSTPPQPGPRQPHAPEATPRQQSDTAVEVADSLTRPLSFPSAARRTAP